MNNQPPRHTPLTMDPKLRTALRKAGVNPKALDRLPEDVRPVTVQPAAVATSQEETPAQVAAKIREHGNPFGQYCVSFARAAGIRKAREKDQAENEGEDAERCKLPRCGLLCLCCSSTISTRTERNPNHETRNTGRHRAVRSHDGGPRTAGSSHERRALPGNHRVHRRAVSEVRGTVRGISDSRETGRAETGRAETEAQTDAEAENRRETESKAKV